MLDTGGQVLIYDLRKANVFPIKPGTNLILLFEIFPIILSICSKHELLSTSSEHDGAQLHPFGKDLFLATLVYDVAKTIIQKFPYLCEKIGSGYDGWYICIKDKLKNVEV
jgi:hypothetical protein